MATFRSDPILLNTGALVPDGTVFTVYTTVPEAISLKQLGTIVTTDRDPLTDGVQVTSHNGVIEFTVSFPPGVTQPRVIGFAPNGTAFGSQVIFLLP